MVCDPLDALHGEPIPQAVAGCEQPDLLDALGSIGCPTLVIIGNEDETFLEASVAMADAIPGSSLVVIPDAGHSPQFENPGAWRSALEEFLAQLEHDAVR